MALSNGLEDESAPSAHLALDESKPNRYLFISPRLSLEWLTRRDAEAWKSASGRQAAFVALQARPDLAARRHVIEAAVALVSQRREGRPASKQGVVDACNLLVRVVPLLPHKDDRIRSVMLLSETTLLHGCAKFRKTTTSCLGSLADDGCVEAAVCMVCLPCLAPPVFPWRPWHVPGDDNAENASLIAAIQRRLKDTALNGERVMLLSKAGYDSACDSITALLCGEWPDALTPETATRMPIYRMAKVEFDRNPRRRFACRMLALRMFKSLYLSGSVLGMPNSATDRMLRAVGGCLIAASATVDPRAMRRWSGHVTAATRWVAPMAPNIMTGACLAIAEIMATTVRGDDDKDKDGLALLRAMQAMGSDKIGRREVVLGELATAIPTGTASAASASARPVTRSRSSTGMSVVAERGASGLAILCAADFDCSPTLLSCCGASGLPETSGERTCIASAAIRTARSALPGRIVRAAAKIAGSDDVIPSHIRVVDTDTADSVVRVSDAVSVTIAVDAVSCAASRVFVSRLATLLSEKADVSVSTSVGIARCLTRAQLLPAAWVELVENRILTKLDGPLMQRVKEMVSAARAEIHDAKLVGDMESRSIIAQMVSQVRFALLPHQRWRSALRTAMVSSTGGLDDGVAATAAIVNDLDCVVASALEQAQTEMAADPETATRRLTGLLVGLAGQASNSLSLALQLGARSMHWLYNRRGIPGDAINLWAGLFGICGRLESVLSDLQRCYKLPASITTVTLPRGQKCNVSEVVAASLQLSELTPKATRASWTIIPLGRYPYRADDAVDSFLVADALRITMGQSLHTLYRKAAATCGEAATPPVTRTEALQDDVAAALLRHPVMATIIVRAGVLRRATTAKSGGSRYATRLLPATSIFRAAVATNTLWDRLMMTYDTFLGTAAVSLTAIAVFTGISMMVVSRGWSQHVADRAITIAAMTVLYSGALASISPSRRFQTAFPCVWSTLLAVIQPRQMVRMNLPLESGRGWRLVQRLDQETRRCFMREMALSLASMDKKQFGSAISSVTRFIGWGGNNVNRFAVALGLARTTFQPWTTLQTLFASILVVSQATCLGFGAFRIDAWLGIDQSTHTAMCIATALLQVGLSASISPGAGNVPDIVARLPQFAMALQVVSAPLWMLEHYAVLGFKVPFFIDLKSVATLQVVWRLLAIMLVVHSRLFVSYGDVLGAVDVKSLFGWSGSAFLLQVLRQYQMHWGQQWISIRTGDPGARTGRGRLWQRVTPVWEWQYARSSDGDRRVSAGLRMLNARTTRLITPFLLPSQATESQLAALVPPLHRYAAWAVKSEADCKLEWLNHRMQSVAFNWVRPVRQMAPLLLTMESDDHQDKASHDVNHHGDFYDESEWSEPVSQDLILHDAISAYLARLRLEHARDDPTITAKAKECRQLLESPDRTMSNDLSNVPFLACHPLVATGRQYSLQPHSLAKLVAIANSFTGPQTKVLRRKLAAGFAPTSIRNDDGRWEGTASSRYESFATARSLILATAAAYVNPAIGKFCSSLPEARPLPDTRAPTSLTELEALTKHDRAKREEEDDTAVLSCGDTACLFPSWRRKEARIVALQVAAAGVVDQALELRHSRLRSLVAHFAWARPTVADRAKARK